MKVETMIPASVIELRVAQLARAMADRAKDQLLIVVPVLDGAKPLCASLMWEALKTHKNITVGPVTCKSYKGTESGVLTIATSNDLIDVITSVNSWPHHRLVIVDDVYDSGQTLFRLICHLESQWNVPLGSIEVITLLKKTTSPEKWRVDYHDYKITSYRGVDVPHYTGFTVDPCIFVVGYGMDYNGQYRNLDYVGELQK